MKKKNFILLLGGCRSGKSELAEQMAAKEKGPVVYIATLVVGDEEVSRRVAIHRDRRPAHWLTVEEPINLIQKIRELGQKPGVLLIDCLTGWLTNLFLSDDLPSPGATDTEKEAYIMDSVAELASAVVQSKADVLIVSNEVGMGLVPPYPMGRAFRDLSGMVNSYLAKVADEVYLVVAGLAVEIKSLAVKLDSQQ